jgi:aspartate aminotransferase
VFSLAAGEADFDTPQYIKDAAIRALQQGETRYAPVAGLPALQKAIALKLQRENGLAYEPGQVVVSNGARQSLYNVFAALLEPGDEVILPAPYWLSYPEIVRIAGGEPVFVHGREDRGYKLQPSELQAAITPRTRALVLNSPSNPSGVVYTSKELRSLAELAANHGLYLVSDETYEKLVYEDAVHASPGSFARAILDRTITVNGFGSSHAMAGWRLGYLAGPLPVVRAVCALQSHSTSGPNTFAQFGALAALRGPSEETDAMLAGLAERRSYVLARLSSIPGVTYVKPMGAFYVLPNIGRFGLDSVAFCERLIQEAHVAAAPGVSFGADACVRLTYACGMETLREGMDRFTAFVKGL